MASSNVARGGRSSRVIRHLGNALIVIGFLLLALTAGLWGYSQYLGWQAEQERQRFIEDFERSTAPVAATAPAALRPPEAAAPTTIASQTTNPDSNAAGTTGGDSTVPETTDSAAVNPATNDPAVAESAVTTPAAPPVPEWQTAPPPRRITVPKIELDTRVMVSEIKDGTWEVPKFVAGYLDGTGRPTKEGGNVVLSGHIQSLTSGNVFARIGELEWGDSVILYSDQGKFEYEITAKRIVKPDNVDVTFPTDHATVTLITCTGDWDPISRDYTQRLVMVGKLIAVNGDRIS